MKRLWIILAAGLAVVAFGPAQLHAEAIEGAKVYNDQCARCHLPRAPWEYNDAAWDVIIHHMHVRGYLTEAERKSVLKYLQESNFRAAFVPAVPPAEVGAEDGAALVARLGCQACHTIGGKGGTIGPSLDTLFERRDAAYVMRKLNNPTFDNPTSVMPYFGLTEAQLKAIADHLKAIGP